SMRDYKINIIYEGKITHQITKAFVSLTESDMEELQEPDEVRRKVFHVMVECLQNITKHAGITDNKDEKERGRGIFTVSKSNNGYTIITGNLTTRTGSEELTEMLDRINNLSKEELKELYKKQIMSGRKLSEKGGAGLGFIDIARKTGNKIGYQVIQLNDGLTFFILEVKVNKKLS
ncbi:MAG: SiaB family protein kinase, partial [Bacteroidota bacterium]